MRLEMPKDYNPSPLPVLYDRSKPSGQMYWIWDRKGYAKKFTEATPEEVAAFLASLTGKEAESKEEVNALSLLSIRTVVIDELLLGEIKVYSMLLGMKKSFDRNKG